MLHTEIQKITLREFMHKTGLSIRQVAQITGVAYPTIASYTNFRNQRPFLKKHLVLINKGIQEYLESLRNIEIVVPENYIEYDEKRWKPKEVSNQWQATKKVS